MVQKKAIVHKVLGVLSSGDKYNYSDEDILIELSKKRSWIDKLLGKKYSIPEVNYACNVIKDDLGKDALLIASDKSGYSWIIAGNEGITKIRGYYNVGAYKEPIKWWGWQATTIYLIAAIIGSIGVIDTLQSPALRKKISEQDTYIKSLEQQIARDSITLDSIRDLSKTLESSQTDSLP